MEELKQEYYKVWGYIPTTQELLDMYQTGELLLTDKQEDLLASLLK